MNSTLEDIREKLKNGCYKNEEHIRACLVLRILQKLNWNIWNPAEVYAELKVAPEEDKTKVDLALFINKNIPSIFFEIKKPGEIATGLPEIERQLRNYNRNNTALFSVITDGQEWRLYHSQTGGEFSKKCFKVFNLLQDGIEDIELFLSAFLDKKELENGNAEKEALRYLALIQKQQVMEDCFTQARRKSNFEPPYNSIPVCLVELMEEKGDSITIEEAVDFIKHISDKETATKSVHISQGNSFQPTVNTIQKPPISPNVKRLHTDNIGDLSHTKITRALFGNEQFSIHNWNELLRHCIYKAYKQGIQFNELRSFLNVNLELNTKFEGYDTGHYKGFTKVENTNFSMQGLSAKQVAENLVLLAKKLKCEIRVEIRWTNTDKQAVIEWRP